MVTPPRRRYRALHEGWKLGSPIDGPTSSLRTVTDRAGLRVDDHPIALPHFEGDVGDWRFLGEPLPDGPPDIVPTVVGCTGDRPLHAFDARAQELIADAHAAGHVVAAGPAAVRPSGGVVLSPHPDDAVLALGSAVAESAHTVVDVFTVERWTHRPYYRQRPALTEALLLREEAVALRVLDARWVALGHVDAPQRRDGEDYLVPRERVDAALAEDDALIEHLVDEVAAHLRPDGAVFAPLGAGGHIDHLVCNEVAVRLYERGALDTDRVSFYEDVPPSLFEGPHAAVDRVRRRLDIDLARDVVRSPPDAARRKAEALRVYRLQVPSGIVARVVRSHRGSDGWAEEPVWRPA